MLLNVVPDRQTVLGVRNPSLIHNWRIILSSKKILLCKLWSMAMALQAPFASSPWAPLCCTAPDSSSTFGLWELGLCTQKLFFFREMASRSGHPCCSCCMVERWKLGQEGTEKLLSCQPARIESCQQTCHCHNKQSSIAFKMGFSKHRSCLYLSDHRREVQT